MTPDGRADARRRELGRARATSSQRRRGTATRACAQPYLRRRLGLLAVVVLLSALLISTTRALVERTGTVRIHNPLQLGGRPLSCPDPDVFRVSWLNEWVAACTSDHGQDNPGRHVNAVFPLYISNDLEHWRFRSFVFPRGDLPWQAQSDSTGGPEGLYWSPEVHFIAGRWVIYFAARIAPTIFQALHHQAVPPGTFGLFVAWTNRLFGGEWHSRLLHYSGQFNDVPGNAKEISGGLIDPSVARDPASGKLYIVYVKQSNEIFISQLSANGLQMGEHVHFALSPRYSWECDPGPLERNRAGGCVVEGPVLYPDKRHHVLDLFFNGASTWRGSYKIGVAVSADPLTSWVTYPRPILRGGNGLFGPGIGAQPVTVSDGSTYIFFHIQLRPSHESQARYLAVGQLRYDRSADVRVWEPSHTGSGSADPGAPTTLRSVPVPQVGNGVVERNVSLRG